MAIIPDASDVVTDHVDYPESDGRPVAETPIHRDNLLYSVYRLEQWFARDPMIYVSGNMFLYYDRGNSRKNVAPDVFVVLGASRDKPRRVYKVWEEEGRTPDMVMEITSRNTQVTALHGRRRRKPRHSDGCRAASRIRTLPWPPPRGPCRRLPTPPTADHHNQLHLARARSLQS
jgi:hypothetical protein